MWPYSGGTVVPIYGVIAGKHQVSNAAVACDPITYFTTGLIANPSMLIMGKPGLGKSTLAVRMIIGLEAMGVHSLVLGDLRPDYVAAIRAVGGQVITLGRNVGHLNILDHQYAVDTANKVAGLAPDKGSWAAIYELPERLRQRFLGDAHGRRKTGVENLLNVLRRKPPEELETNLIDVALQILFKTWNGPSVPLLLDLVKVLEEAPDELRLAALDHGDIKVYHRRTDDLVSSLRALAMGGGLGEIFSRRTDVEMRMDCSVNFNISTIARNELPTQAAALISCWNYGFGQVDVHNLLADEGLVKRQNFLAILDEMWRALQAGHGMVDRINESTRLNREDGIGMLYITHTLADMDLMDEEDRAKARGIAERCGIIGLFGLPDAEITKILPVIHLSRAERGMLTSWANPGSWKQYKGQKAKPPGLSLWLLKVAGRTGIPVRLDLVEAEEGLHDTNQRWADMARAS